MTRSNVARQQGDDFQARMFWLKAVSLLDPNSPVRKVSFETGPKAFDDIVVEHHPERAPSDHEDHPIHREYIQCKWHTTAGGFGFHDLADPAFINAQRFSFLHRAHQAQLEHAPDGTGCQFVLMTNWRINREDPLLRLIRTQTGSIDLGRLFDGTTDRSRMGAVRKLWCEHLGVDHAGLQTILRTVRIAEKPDVLDALREQLDDKCAARGLKRIPTAETACLYDDLFRKLLDQGRCEFDAERFKAMAERENLFEDRAHPEPVLTVGVKSFVHPIDELENRCERTLDLVARFDGRYIRNPEDWQTTIYPELEAFILEAARSTDHFRLILDTHVSLAFAAGTIVNVKSGKQIEIEQRTAKRRWWAMDDITADPSWPSLVVQEDVIDPRGDEVAVAIGLTHDVSQAVAAYVRWELNQVGTTLYCQPEGGPSYQSVVCGRHAWSIAERVVHRIRAVRSETKPLSRVHIFIAGPNGFAFFLGQHQKAIGQSAIYEWDFDGLRGGGYSLGLTVPPR